jgi:hypothetical protein
LAWCLCAVLFAAPSSALAYIGPGAGLSAIGVFLAVIGAIVLLIAGFVWYPAKRLLRWLKGTGGSDQSGSAG